MSARAQRPTDPGGGSRAFAPGSRRASALALAALALFVAGLLLFLTRSRPPPSPSSLFAPSPSASAQGYGGLPGWLPTPKVRVGRVVHASAAHPWLAIEGDTVVVSLARARVTMTAVGPAVPAAARFPVPHSTPCRFAVTFSAASGAIALSQRAFTIVDELGRLHHPRVTSRRGGAPPRELAPGRTLTLTVSDVLPTGAGRLAWSAGAGRTIVAWDFAVEID